MSAPRSTHYAVALRILRYVKGTIFHGLHFSSQSSLILRAYSDADWAGDPTDRRSTIGYCFFLSDSLISWRSKKQSVVARSSTEVEYRALADATSELLWLHWLIQDLGIDSPSVTLHCDNHNAIQIAHNDVFHERTKHIEIDCHFIRHHLQQGVLHLVPVRSIDQLADLFTKTHPTSRFQDLLSKLKLTGKEVWDYLAERYSSVDGTNEYQLGLELHHLRFDSGQTLTNFYNKLSNLWNHLAQFEPTWTCPIDAAAFYAYRDRSRLCHFLMVLPPDYEHIRASLLHRHPLPTVGQALAELRSEETRKKNMVYQHSQSVLATPVWEALQPSSQSVRVPSPKNIPSGSQKKYCSFCRRDTHSYEDCHSRSKSKRKEYHNRQTAVVTDSSGPSPDSSSSTLTAADVETTVTQVLSRTNLHSSAL
ncbi:hypothetical protein Acr_00g0042610 [Actinidia rufa]|uniref:Uncharacterized protein n=1 Tax=Actinidia rufa TaxID=165716 RepID=A0A7J0DIC5_9ERIC|nr:hypothetical protein Acr_00g0042610 [Actinidia rufa]